MSQSYADIAHERDELKCEIATLRSLMDRMLEKGKKLEEENKKYVKSIEDLTARKCALRCPLVEQARKEIAKEIYKEARERVNEGIEWLNCSKDKPGNKYMKGVTFGLNLFDKALINAIKKYGVEVKG